MRGQAGRFARPLVRVLLIALVLVPPLITIRHEQRFIDHDRLPYEQYGYALRELRDRMPLPAPLIVVMHGHFNTALRPVTALGGDSGYNAPLRYYLETLPRPARVIHPRELSEVSGPALLLTARPQDSSLLRTVLPQATVEQVSTHPTYLWTVPGKR